MLPYGVICNCVDPNFSASVDWTLFKINLQDGTIETTNDEWNDEFAVENIKPYLRPISSMTEKEKEDFGVPFTSEGLVTLADTVECMDWLNANHFDYRGLIEKGLAIEVTKENNPYK